MALAGRTQRGSQASGWLKEHGLDDLIAGTEEDYIRLAKDLAGDPERLADATNRVRALDAPGVSPEFLAWLAETLVDPITSMQPEKRYFFHHIAKTGGSSFRRVLESWFEVVPDYHEAWDQTSIQPAIDLVTLSSNQVVSGHYRAGGVRLETRYPNLVKDDGFHMIAFVREPLDWVLSDYHYSRKRRPEFQSEFVHVPLRDYLIGHPTNLRDWLDCDENTWRTRLDQYWFIGTLERFDECVAYLADEMGKPLPDVIPFENATTRSEDPDPDAVAEFRKNNALDYEIYDAVNARLDRLLGPRKGD